MKKLLNQKDLFSIALGAVIGWGAFVLPGNFFLSNAGVINTLVGFSIAVIMLYFIEKCYSLLISTYPESGGEFTFAKNVFGDKVGFVTGWMLLLAYISIIPLNATAIPMVLSRIIPFYEQGLLLYNIAGFPVYENDLMVSLLTISIFTFINIKGLQGAKWAQNICVFGLLGSLILIVMLSFYNIDNENISNLNSNLGTLDFYSVVRIIAFAPWAFIGFDTVAQMSEDYEIDSKKASLAAFLAVVFGALVYNVLNIFTALGVSSSDLDSSIWATGDAVYNVLGPYAILLLAVAMFGAVASGLNGFFISSSRLLLSMYRSEKRDRKIQMSSKILLFIGFISCVVPFFGRNALFWFVDLASVGASFAYLVTCSAALKITKSVKVKLYAFVGVFVSLSFLLFLLTPFFKVNIPLISVACLIIWLIIGVIFYKISSKNTAIQLTTKFN